MITIEEEVSNIIHLMSGQIEYTLSIGNIILNSICGIEECWIVTWQQEDSGIQLQYQRDFNNLPEAALFFVEKRRYMCVGSDFENAKAEDD
jgi:hypothetical protein